MTVGDQNTKFFHRVIKGKLSRNTNLILTSVDGRYLTGEKEINDVILGFCIKLLGTTDQSCNGGNFTELQSLVYTYILSDLAQSLIRIVAKEEITQVIQEMPPKKSLGSSGFTNEFF